MNQGYNTIGMAGVNAIGSIEGKKEDFLTILGKAIQEIYEISTRVRSEASTISSRYLGASIDKPSANSESPTYQGAEIFLTLQWIRENLEETKEVLMKL